MTATPQDTPPLTYSDEWPDPSAHGSELSEAEAFALTWQGRSDCQPTPQEFFTIQAMAALNGKPAAEAFGAGESDALAAANVAEAFAQFRPERVAPLGETDRLALAAFAGWLAAMGAHPKTSVAEIVRRCFREAVRIAQQTTNQQKEAAK